MIEANVSRKRIIQIKGLNIEQVKSLEKIEQVNISEQ